MTWASACGNRPWTTSSRPRPPAPTSATLTLSLGGTNPRPPRTCRGTMVNTPAAAAPAFRNARRDGRSAAVIACRLRVGLFRHRLADDDQAEAERGLLAGGAHR